MNNIERWQGKAALLSLIKIEMSLLYIDRIKDNACSLFHLYGHALAEQPLSRVS